MESLGTSKEVDQAEIMQDPHILSLFILESFC
jgi:hypothetical protein